MHSAKGFSPGEATAGEPHDKGIPSPTYALRITVYTTNICVTPKARIKIWVDDEANALDIYFLANVIWEDER
jgi:hypothetical protein